MSDLWLAAGEDAERERYQRHLATARSAVVDPVAFALGAATPEEFEHRLALVADRFDAAVATVVGDAPGDFLNVRVALLDEVNADFGRIHAAREAEAAAERQRVAARRQAELAAAHKKAAAAQLNAEFAKLAAKRPPSDNSQDEMVNWGSTEDDGELIDWSEEKNKRKIKPLATHKVAAFEEGSALSRIDAAFSEAGFSYSGTTMFGKQTWSGPAGVTITLESWDEYAMHAIFGFDSPNGRYSDGGSVTFDSPNTQAQINQLVGRLKAMVTRLSRSASRKTAGPYDADWQPGDAVGYRYSPGDAVIVTNWNGAESKGHVIADPADGMPNDAFVDFHSDETGDEYPVNRRQVTPAGTRAWSDAQRSSSRKTAGRYQVWDNAGPKHNPGAEGILVFESDFYDLAQNQLASYSEWTGADGVEFVDNEPGAPHSFYRGPGADIVIEGAQSKTAGAYNDGYLDGMQGLDPDVVSADDPEYQRGYAAGKAAVESGAWVASRKQATWSRRTKVATADREVPTWVGEANGRDLVVIAINRGFTWAVYGEGDEPLAKGRAAKLELAQNLAATASAGA